MEINKIAEFVSKLTQQLADEVMIDEENLVSVLTEGKQKVSISKDESG